MKPTGMIPDFSLPSSTGQTLSRDSFRGKVPLAIVFLPDLESAGCVELLTRLNERLPDFGAQRSQVLAVVAGTARATRDFAEEHGIVMPILADASGAMARDYQADLGEAGTVAVVANREGELVRRFDPLPFDGAADGLLSTVRALGSGSLNIADH